MKEVYWFRLPDDLDWLLSRPSSELKAYMLLARDVQKGKSPGELSIRKIAKATGVVFQTAQAAINSLVDQGRVIAQKRSGGTTKYSLPVTWAKGKKKQADYSPGDEQLDGVDYSPGDEQSDRHYSPGDEQNYSPGDEQHYSPGDEQHKEIRNSESSESSESTTTTVPSELADLLPDLLDAKAQRRIWNGARTFAPDVTVPEVIAAAYVKLRMLGKKANSGLLITSVPGMFEGRRGFHIRRREAAAAQLEATRRAEAEYQELLRQLAAEEPAA